MRVIEADAVVKAIDKHTNSNLQLDEDITCILEEVPTIEERKTGEWIDKRLAYSDVSVATCSNCKKRVVVGDFCSHCGADMRRRKNV